MPTNTTPTRHTVQDLGKPISEVIRARIKASGKRFFANDNISEFIFSSAEMDQLVNEVQEKMEGVLRSLVIDTEGDHNTQGTARRVAKMYLKEIFGGRYVGMPAVTAFPNVEHINELIMVGPITVRSACSHHLCPIIGKIWVGVLPHADSSLIGLSKYVRITDWVMSRPQIQEEAVKMLADEIEKNVNPAGLALVMEADHFCMHWRGVKDSASMISSVMRGAFLQNHSLRKEFLSLIRR